MQHIGRKKTQILPFLKYTDSGASMGNVLAFVLHPNKVVQ